MLRPGVFGKIVPLLLTALILSLVPGCSKGSAEAIVPIELVPQGVTSLAHISLGQILNDEDLTGIFDVLPMEEDGPQNFDEAVEDLKEELGIDIRDYDEILYFAEDQTISAASAASFGDGFDGDLFEDVSIELQTAILTGVIEEDGFIAAVEETMEEVLDPTDYKGYELYSGPRQEVAVAFLSTTAVVIGIPDMVKSVIDVKVGDESPLSGRLLDEYNQLGDALIKSVAIASPAASDDALREAPGLLPIPLDLDALADIDISKSTFAKTGEAITLNSETCFNNAEAVDTMESLFGIIKLLPLMMPFAEGDMEDSQIPEEAMELLVELLDRIETESTDQCFKVSFEITLTELEDLIEQLVQIDSEAVGPGEVY
jgi:hypothetical protein